MEIADSVAAEQSPKNTIQKLWAVIKGDSSFQTIVAVFSALGFVIAFKDVSHLAGQILELLDSILTSVAHAVSEIFPFHIAAYQAKEALLLLPPIIFLITGVNSLGKDDGGLKTKSDEPSGETLRQDAEIGRLTIGPVEIVGVDAMTDQGVLIKGRIRTLTQGRWVVLRAYNQKLKAAFDSAGKFLGHKI